MKVRTRSDRVACDAALASGGLRAGRRRCASRDPGPVPSSPRSSPAEAGLRAARVEERYAGIDLERVVELRRGRASSEHAHDEAHARFESAQAEVARAQAALDTLGKQLSYATETSPLAGRVLDVPVEVGSAVSPVTAVTGGTLLLSLAATSRLFLEGLVDENEIARVAIGQEACLRSEAWSERSFRGRVAEIAAETKEAHAILAQIFTEDAAAGTGRETSSSPLSGEG